MPLNGTIPNILPHGHRRYLQMDSLLSATSLPRRYVILVLGAPTYRDLTPVLLSGNYAHSLVIVATHQPPDIPHIVIPALRILRLSASLTGENACATRLARLLAWAEQVTRDWRKYGGSGISELCEDDDSANLPHPPGRVNSWPGGEPVPSRRASMQQNPNRGESQTDRPFDALINFLPGHITNDITLRQVILVTAISRPFLGAFNAAHTSLLNGLFGTCKSVFGSLRGRSGRAVSMDLPRTHVEGLFSSRTANILVASAGAPHILHLLPDTAAQYPQATFRLVESMETILSAFACLTSLDSDLGHLFEVQSLARSYVMHSSTFHTALDCALSHEGQGEKVGAVGDPWGCEWTVADVVLSGTLDGAVNTSGSMISDLDGHAWISGPEDIVLVPSWTHPSDIPPTESKSVPTGQLAAVQDPASAPEFSTSAEGQSQSDRRKSISVYSYYSTSYGHSQMRSSNTSLHHGSVDATEGVSSHNAHPNLPPQTIEEIPISPTSSHAPDGRTLVKAVPRQWGMSVQKVRSVWKSISGWKPTGKEKAGSRVLLD